MRLADEITIRRVSTPQPARRGLRSQAPVDSDAQPWCEVLRHGRPSGCVLKGATLEAAVETHGRYLLLLTDDVPFEEFLVLVLLSADLQILDKAAIGICYGTGTFTGLLLLPPQRVQFMFLGDRPWQVQLLDAPELRLPWRPEPRGVARRLRMWRHFRVLMLAAD